MTASEISSLAPLDVAAVRRAFPALARTQNGLPVIFADNPAGTQVPQACMDAIVDYMTVANANSHGAFSASVRNDELSAAAHEAMANFLNAADPREIVFGPNMTTLTFAMSRAIGRTLKPGDEIVVTALDHDANVAPWLALQEERGAVVRIADVDLATCTLDMADLRSKITDRTRVVAVGYASNAVGTINDVATIIGWAHEVGALAYIDAVQYAPHGPIDVQALGADFLVCSAYKFYGPHQGILWGKLEHLERLSPYKVRPASDTSPDRWETGTPTYELQSGVRATLRYLAELGASYEAAAQAIFPGMPGSQNHSSRLPLHAAMAAIQAHERELIKRLLAGLKPLPGATLYGLTDESDASQMARRVPTVALTITGHTPRELATALGERGISTWDGNYYALTLMERLGLEGRGGALRIGLAHYNTADEVDRIVAALREIVG